MRLTSAHPAAADRADRRRAISVTLHAAGIRSLVAELADQEPPAASEAFLEAAE
jgi:hypothetical protein